MLLRRSTSRQACRAVLTLKAGSLSPALGLPCCSVVQRCISHLAPHEDVHACRVQVRISEMLLGPAPASFRFAPKHKANAYAASEGAMAFEAEGEENG